MSAEPMTATTPLAVFAMDWFARVATRVRPQTLAGYRQSMMIHWLPRLGHVALADLRRRDVRDVLRELLATGRAANSARNDLRVLSTCLEDAVDDELLRTNPARGAGHHLFPRQSRESRALPADQAARLLDAASRADADAFDLIALLLLTGVRIGELLGARWADFDLDGRTFTIARSYSRGNLGPTKSGRVHTIELSDYAAELLAARQFDFIDTSYVFESPTKARWPLSYVTAWRIVQRVARQAGLPGVRVHALRHSFGTALIAHADASVVQDQLTHAHIQTTLDVYVRDRPRRARHALNAVAAPLRAVRPPRRAAGA